MSALTWKCTQCNASFFKDNLLRMHQNFFHKEQPPPFVKQATKIIVPAMDPPDRVLEKISASLTPNRTESDESEDSEVDRARLERKFNNLKVVQRVHAVDSFPEDAIVNNSQVVHMSEVEVELPEIEDGDLSARRALEKIEQEEDVCFLVVKEDGIYVMDKSPFVENSNLGTLKEELTEETADEEILEEHSYYDVELDEHSGIRYRVTEHEADSDTAISYTPEPATVSYRPGVAARRSHGAMEMRKLRAMRGQGLHVKRLGVMEFKCKRCEEVFPTKHERRLHLETHAQDLRYFCSVCGRGFRKTHSLKLHLNVHTEGSRHQCPYCLQFYRAERYLKEHVKLHMPEMYKFECEICNKKFAHKVSWRYHMRSHTKETPYQCNLCGKAYRQRVSLEAHLNLHEGARPHKCAECGKGFRTASTLRDHRRLHTNERPFVCRHPGCDKKYILKNQLKSHMKKHTGVRNFACSVGACEKRFFFRSHLVRHLTRTHKLRAVDEPAPGAEPAQAHGGAYYVRHAETESDLDSS